jgi:hypothetical protein
VITGTSDEVQMMSAVRAMQAAGHYRRMLSAVSLPPLQKAQGRGTHVLKREAYSEAARFTKPLDSRRRLSPHVQG